MSAGQGGRGRGPGGGGTAIGAWRLAGAVRRTGAARRPGQPGADTLPRPGEAPALRNLRRGVPPLPHNVPRYRGCIRGRAIAARLHAYITKSIFLDKRLWRTERLESYQYFTQAEFEAAFASLGLRIAHLRTLTVDYEKWRSEVEIVSPGVDFPAEHILNSCAQLGYCITTHAASLHG